MQAEGRVGPILAAEGSIQPARLGKTGEIVVNDVGLGRYYEAAVRGLLFMGANTAAQALTLGVAAATGLILTNPNGSGKNLVILDCQFALDAAVTGVAAVALYAGLPNTTAVTQTTPITPRTGIVGGAPGVGLLASSVTLPAAPILVRPLLGYHWVTAGTPTAGLFVRDEIAGEIILPPGTSLSVQGITVANSGIAGFVWAELNV